MNDRLDFISFSFSFYFIFLIFILNFILLFLILDLGKKYDIMSYVIITQVTKYDGDITSVKVIVIQSCNTEKNIEGSRTDNSILVL